ncbi:ribonuclease P protein subunit [Haloprofundus sp. MHR1]|uniref:ribonuclease P protein subunit n=1 Tax=Haloprofundus sp. MHR1 TaxID=2572921 RepID=UPI0010BF235A|nr:ribonuclease P protein subunit [Haloprofundus sp. MHR1]QCJ46157.1 ribonuclease P [Haloprofundus sp. MHR1]
MALTPERLARHELNGLPVRVAAADNPDLVGIAGRVVVETMQTLHVDCDVPAAARLFGDEVAERGARVVQVPKRGTTFEFALERTDGGPTTGPSRTNEAAGNRRDNLDESSDTRRRRRKAPGSASKRESETAGDLAGQSGSTREGSSDDGLSDDCEGAVYVTVDGAKLLSRPALRTENVGESTWR